MKKIYILLLSVIIFRAAAQVASCTLDPAFISSNKKGIWPDSATNFISGTVGQPYMQNLTVKVPLDTVSGGFTFCFNRVEVSTPNGYTNFNLPAGLSMLAGNNVTVASGTYKFPGNANTCALLSGTPTTAGSYTIQFKVQPYVTPSGGSCSASPNVSGGSALTSPTTLSYYIINILAAAGIKEEVSAKTINLSNAPNPFSSKTQIRFTVKDEASAKLTVYNILGSKIFEEKIRTTAGDNIYELDAADWSGGMYLYTLQYKNYTASGRMVINPAR
jgi:hypothetical protein